MSENFESYKKVAVEFHTLYLAFLSAGFSEEQAFEMTRTYCNSTVAQSILESDRLARSRRDSMDRMRERLRDRANKEDSE
jgi:hypothetical protein